MALRSHPARRGAFALCVLGLALACSGDRGDTEPVAPRPGIFVRAEPAVEAVLTRPPRTLRVYLSALPDVSKSSLALFGPEGEVALSRFHTMGADDLMIEVTDRPLPTGEYRVEWTATVEGDAELHRGSYAFTVAER